MDISGPNFGPLKEDPVLSSLVVNNIISSTFMVWKDSGLLIITVWSSKKVMQPLWVLLFIYKTKTLILIFRQWFIIQLKADLLV